MSNKIKNTYSDDFIKAPSNQMSNIFIIKLYICLFCSKKMSFKVEGCDLHQLHLIKLFLLARKANNDSFDEGGT